MGIGKELDQRSAQSEIGVHTAIFKLQETDSELLSGPNSLFVLYGPLIICICDQLHAEGV